jgi:hypothetical protein
VQECRRSYGPNRTQEAGCVTAFVKKSRVSLSSDEFVFTINVLRLPYSLIGRPVSFPYSMWLYQSQLACQVIGVQWKSTEVVVPTLAVSTAHLWNTPVGLKVFQLVQPSIGVDVDPDVLPEG